MAVFGALAGATSLNEMAVGAWGDEGRPSCTSPASATTPRSPRVPRPGYVLMPQTDHFGDVLAAADIAVSRAGGTVWELAAAGTPSILVPYPYATGDHQTLNARHFERGGGAIVVPNADRVGAGARARAARRPGAPRLMRRRCWRWRASDAADRIAEGVTPCPTLSAQPRRSTPVLRRHRRLRLCLREHGPRPRRRGARLGPAGHDLPRHARGDRGRSRRRAGPPAGWEVVVSTAHRHRIDGLPARRLPRRARTPRSRRSSSAAPTEDDDRGDDRVRPAETGRDPAWIIGGVVPQLGGNAGAGPGWLVVEGDESDRSIGSLRPQIAVLTNVELDHHADLRIRGRAARVLRRLAPRYSARRPELGARAGRPRARRPGEHNRQNAAAALAALELAGVRRAEAKEAIVRFRASTAAPARRGTWRRLGLRRLRPQPDRARGDAAHGPGAHRRARDCGLPAARRRAHEAASPTSSAPRSGLPTPRREDIIGARDAPREGVTGKLVVDALPPEVRAGWAPTPEDAAALALAWVRPGDLLAHLRRGGSPGRSYGPSLQGFPR